MSAPQTPFYPMTHDDAQDMIAAIGEQSKFADPYDSTATYSQGDHCIHAGKYYAAKQDISTAEEWTAAHWEEVQVGEEITAQAKTIGKILPVITGTTNNSGYAISSGEYFEANGKLYKATASIPTGNAWSSSATEQTDHGAINALNSKMIKSLTETKTSNQNGDIITSLTSDKKLISVVSANNNMLPQAIYNNKWVVTLCNHEGTGASSFITIPNTEATYTLYYLD
jgi:hypothetical protein